MIKKWSPLYKRWQHMLQRCENPNHHSYRNYGGRGITVCERWHKFENMLEDIGEPPHAKATLDRIDNNRGYEPGNTRWVTIKVQNRNRRSNFMVAYNGETKPLSEWCEQFTTDPHSIELQSLIEKEK
jgi:hypothetical protein